MPLGGCRECARRAPPPAASTACGTFHSLPCSTTLRWMMPAAVFSKRGGPKEVPSEVRSVPGEAGPLVRSEAARSLA
jgi:hypothetical protein